MPLSNNPLADDVNTLEQLPFPHRQRLRRKAQELLPWLFFLGILEMLRDVSESKGLAPRSKTKNNRASHDVELQSTQHEKHRSEFQSLVIVVQSCH